MVTLNYDEVANLILVVEGDTTTHDVSQRARCHNCGVKGNNTYQIVQASSVATTVHWQPERFLKAS